jgi:hypothetical protein
VALLVAAAMTVAGSVIADGGSDPSFASRVLHRFLSRQDPARTSYRALRHLQADSERLGLRAWMDVWTDLEEDGSFHYAVLGEGGSDYTRSKVFRGILDGELKFYASGPADRSDFTLDNYLFDEQIILDQGSLARLAITPRRKDVALVNGFMFLDPADGGLVRVEGRLAKSPSFWIKRVDIVRRYERKAGVRMPVALDSVASVRFAGRSTLHMNYDYERVNGERVGTPQPIGADAAVVDTKIVH